MVRVAMQLMAGHMYKAATSTRKFLKTAHWLLKVRCTAHENPTIVRRQNLIGVFLGILSLSVFFFLFKCPSPPRRPSVL